MARLDRKKGCQPFFKVVLDPPARACHDSWDYCDITSRFVDAMCLIRQVTGESAHWEEQELRRFLLRMANSEDGLFYNQEGENSCYAADMFCQSRALIALCTWHGESGDPEPLHYLRRLARGLINIAERRNGYAFYPRNLYRGGEWIEGGLFYSPKDLWTVKAGYGGTQLEGMMKYFALTQDDAALQFVREYLKYFLDQACVVDENGNYSGHLHSQGIVPTMVGAAMLAEVTCDADLMAHCDRFLRFTLAHCSSFGWVPDGIGWPTCETCAIADVIHLATRLSRMGQGDYWYDIERIARNQLLENQFRDPFGVLDGRQPEPGLAEMITGSFASWAHPNDLLGGPDIEACCTGGGVRGIYYVLQNVVHRAVDGCLSVNMLFSVDTAAARIESALPYRGEVKVTLKQRSSLRLRQPEGVAKEDVQLFVNGNPVVPVPLGSAFVVENLSAGDIIEMQFPTPVCVRTEQVAGKEYVVSWKGNSVVSLEPRGGKYPTYQRATWIDEVSKRNAQQHPLLGAPVL